MIRQVYIRNYKSIGQACVTLEGVTVLVGQNGAGKSNFVDALSFVTDVLKDGLDLAFKNRGGIGAVRRRSGGHPNHIEIRLGIELEKDISAEYSFKIAAKPGERYGIAEENCAVHRLLKREDVFQVKDGKFTKEIPGIKPKIEPDRLALFASSATEEFRPVYDFLTAMRFYSIVPSRIRELQDPDPGESLKRDGSNAAAVLKHIAESSSNRNGHYERLCRLLSKVVPGLSGAQYHTMGQKETIRFKQNVGLKYPWMFDALNMSDGTLRLLGILLAVYQSSVPTLIAIEEPEATVHPGITDVLVDVLWEGSKRSQILLTTHSPDILDHKHIRDDQIRVVSSQKGETTISPLAESSRKAIRNELYTPGELLRSDELVPDLTAARKATFQSSFLESRKEE